jgi:hypothetical protein
MQDAHDPYANGLITERPSSRRLPVELRTVGVLASKRTGRGLRLINPRTRCIRQHDIHELIVTHEAARPGQTVNDVRYIGFFEFLESCVIGEGDRLVIGGQVVGELIGFDDTHAPNHLNIVLHAERPVTGEELGLEPGARVQFVPWNH